MNPNEQAEYSNTALGQLWTNGSLPVNPEILQESLLATDNRLISATVLPLLEKDPRLLAEYLTSLRAQVIGENITCQEWPGYSILALRVMASAPLERRLADLKEYDKELQELLNKDEYLQPKVFLLLVMIFTNR